MRISDWSSDVCSSDLAGGIDTLPTDDVFLGADAQALYAVSWWICEYIAAEHGESVLWELLDALAADSAQTTVLHRVLGLTPSELAGRAPDLMASTHNIGRAAGRGRVCKYG